MEDSAPTSTSAVEAGTGGCLCGGGPDPHLAEPAETSALRGPSAELRPTARTSAGCELLARGGAGLPARPTEQQLRARPPPAGLSGVGGPLQDRRADRLDDRLPARRPPPPVGLARVGPLRRDSTSAASPQPPLPSRQADQADSPQLRSALYESAQAALPFDQPRPGRPPRAQASGLSHPRASLTIASNSPSAATTPCPSSAPPPSSQSPEPPPDRLRHAQHSSDGQPVFRPAPVAPATPAPDGGHTKNERPESSPAERPINHHVAGARAEHPDKPGRPRNDGNTPPHNHSPQT